MASELEDSEDYLISRYESAMKAWKDLNDSAAAGELYRSSETYRLDSLKLDSTRSIDGGSFGKIFKGTVRLSYGVRFELHRGPWVEKEPRWSHRVMSRVVGAGEEEGKEITVAVKKIEAEEMPEDEVVEVIREACNVRVLQGTRNVVHVYGVTRHTGLNGVCIVMELVEGSHGDLNRFLRSQDAQVRELPFWWKMKLEIFMELVVGVNTCHRNGVYHGDLKGRNVLLDKFGVPKLIDFGFSFRRRDIDYLNSLGGSLFWISPEVSDVLEAAETLEEFKLIVDNPFPSDVYSLGMLWIEMFRDGFVPDGPEHRDEIDDIMNNKRYPGCPVELQAPPGLDKLKPVFDELYEMVDGCCQDRERRISLEQCLEHAHAAYSQLWSVISDNNNNSDDVVFISSPEYKDMLYSLKRRFPNVVEAFVQQPGRNMVMDINGNTLLDLFCEMDFRLGVEYIIDRAGITWSFKPEKDVPRLCSICARQGSPSVLRLLSSRWKEIIAQEEWLLHEACDGQSDEVFFHLLCDIGMDYDTWHRSSLLKPIHRLAHQGNIKRMKILLDYAQPPEYVNTRLLGESDTPLSYAIEGDKVEAVFFLLERGGTLRQTSPSDPHFLRELFQHAMDFWSLAVMSALLELDAYLENSDTSSVAEKVAHLFQTVHHIDPAHRAFLPLLKSFVGGCERRGVEPFGFACSREGDQAVFQLMITHWKDPIRADRVEDRLWRSLGANGSREMVEYATSVIGFDGWSFQCLYRAARENREVLPFLKETGKIPHDDDDQSKEPRSTYNSAGDLDRAVESGDVHLVSDTLRKLLPDEEYAELIDSLEFQEVIETEGGTPEKLRKLIQQLKQAEDEEWTHLGQALMDECAFHGEQTMVRHLISEGVELDGLEYHHDTVTTPLLQAVAAQDCGMVELLLEAGANPNSGVPPAMGETAMDIAVRCGNSQIVRLLIDYKFDTGMRDKNNATYIDRVTYMTSKIRKPASQSFDQS